MSATKENIEPSLEPEAPAPEAGSFLLPLVPEGFELSDLAHSLKLFSPDSEPFKGDRQFYPDTVYELQRLAAAYESKDLQIVYTGYRPTPVAMANRDVWGRIIEDEFTPKALRFTMFNGLNRRAENKSFRVGDISEELDPTGVDCLVFIKPNAIPIWRRPKATSRLARLALAEQRRLLQLPMVH